MTVTLEKLYFNYILENRKFFDIIKPHFFRNSEIQTVYKIVQTYMLENLDAEKPSPKQILEMVSLEDKDGVITKPILRSILSEELKDYDEQHFIIPKFNTWILINRIKTGAIDIVDETRGLDNISDFDSACEASDKIRSFIEDMTSTSFIMDDEIGSDFDNPESHFQDSSKYKVSSGFGTIDGMLGGGWDIQTLNVIMAETSNGKCFFSSTQCKFKNRLNNDIFSEEIGKTFTNYSKGHTDV